MAQRTNGSVAAAFLSLVVHAVSLLWLRVLRKKRKPLQWLPVMALATALSEG